MGEVATIRVFRRKTRLCRNGAVYRPDLFMHDGVTELSCEGDDGAYRPEGQCTQCEWSHKADVWRSALIQGIRAASKADSL